MRWCWVSGVETDSEGRVQALLVIDSSLPEAWNIGYNARLEPARASSLWGGVWAGRARRECAGLRMGRGACWPKSSCRRCFIGSFFVPHRGSAWRGLGRERRNFCLCPLCSALGRSASFVLRPVMDSFRSSQWELEHGLSDRSANWSSRSLQLTQAAPNSASSDVCYLHP